MFYKDYLKTDHWKKVRKNFIKKKNHSYCYICLSVDELHIHHKYYKGLKNKSILGSESGGQVVRLCKDCHGKWHEHRGFEATSLKGLRKVASLLESGMIKDDAFKLSTEDRYKETVENLGGTWKEVRPADRTVRVVWPKLSFVYSS